jgi:hypothetical protein
MRHAACLVHANVRRQSQERVQLASRWKRACTIASFQSAKAFIAHRSEFTRSKPARLQAAVPAEPSCASNAVPG